jgi:RimJ/RimL family protein N-acetyltransferase
MNNRKNEIFIDDVNIYLRPLHPEDVTAEYIDGLNDPYVNRYLVDVRQNRQTRDSVTLYIEAQWDNPLSILFGIFIKDNQNPFIGTIRVHNIDQFHFSASVGVCLFAKRAWRRGYACNALRLIKEYLFKDVQIHYLEAGVYAENLNSIYCFLHAGFAEHYRVNNKYRHIDGFEDVIFFAAFNPLFDSSLMK